MRVLIMFRPRGEAPERAAEVAAVLQAEGHQVQQRRLSGPATTIAGTRDPADVILAVGWNSVRAAHRAARVSGAALVCDPLTGDPAPSRRTASAVRDATTRGGGGTVLAGDPAHAGDLRAKLRLPYLPPVVGAIRSGPEQADAARVLIAVCERLPGMNPQLPLANSGIADRVRAWFGELGEPIRRGALRRPAALLAYLRGRRLRSRGRLPAAIRSLAHAAEGNNPGDPLYGLYLAKALRESGESVQALECLEALAARVGDDPKVLGEIGIELTRLGQRHPAEAVAKRLADAGGEHDAESQAEAARVYAALGDLSRARELGLLAAAEAADGSGGQRTAARALEQSGEPSRALDLARRAGASDQERRLRGLLRELDPAWIPELPTDGVFEDAAAGRVLTLLEASLPQAPSGYAYRSRDLLAALRAGGFEPVASTRLGFPASRGVPDWSPVETVDGVIYHRINVPGLRQYSGVPLDLQLQENAERLLELVRRHRPLAIIAGTPDLNGVVALALRAATGVPVVYDVRGFPEMSWAARAGGSDSEIYKLRRTAETACASAADAVITLSETMKGEIAGRGVDPKRIFVVPHVADTERFSPRPRNEDLTRSYGLDGRLVVGSVTSLTDYEGIDDLLRAAASARTEVPELAVLIVGDGAYRPTLEELASQLGIGDSVVFTGRIRQEEVPDHYALLDLFAIPRRDLEVCRAVTPLKPFEALAMGIPVLASDLPALAEVVSGSGGGRLVPAGSETELAKAIVELCRDPGERRRLGRRGREYVLAQHTPERATAALRATLNGLVGENGSGDES